MKDVKINISEPIVSFAETVISETGYDGQYPKTCIAKSPNKLNRLYGNAVPLNNNFINDIDNGSINTNINLNSKEFSSLLCNKYNFSKYESKKIWTFGCPTDSLSNIIIDKTKGNQYIDQIKDNVVGSFMIVTKEGVLCNEIIRGIQFNINDTKIHSDPPHRNAGQIIPCAKKLFYACQISSNPRLLEPIYELNIVVPIQQLNNTINTLTMKRGEVESIIEKIKGTPLREVKGYLPVKESFGFTELLRKNTRGEAFPQMKFSHWKQINGNPYDINSNAYKTLINVRKRKGLKQELPKFSDYYDKI